MASAIEQLRSGLTIGHAQLGMHGSRQGTINQQVHDGDTVVRLLEGNVGSASWAWTPLRSASPSPAATGSSASRIRPWRRSSPFRLQPPCPHSTRRSPPRSRFSSPPGSVEERPLISRLGRASTDALRELMRADVAVLGQTEASFQFFCAFPHEVMDGFGRLLLPEPPAGFGDRSSATPAVLQRADARGWLGHPVLYLAQHRPVPPSKVS